MQIFWSHFFVKNAFFGPLKSKFKKKFIKKSVDFDWKLAKYASLYTFLQDVRDFEKSVLY